MGAYQEIKPLCVLDFYVHESCQRSGLGRLLFDTMLSQEFKAPSTLGYDRPSPKLLSFLSKHFNLKSYSPQSNNFVVFDEYFRATVKITSKKSVEIEKELRNNELREEWE